MIDMNNNFKELKTTVLNKIEYLENKNNLNIENIRSIIEDGGDVKLKIAARKLFGGMIINKKRTF
jgi:hypothetical protein